MDMIEGMVDVLWAERMHRNPRTWQRALTEGPFARDCEVSKLVLIKVAASLEERGHGRWMIEQTVRDAIASLIDDSTLDQITIMESTARLPFTPVEFT